MELPQTSSHGEPTRQQRAEWLHAICTAGLAAMDIRFAVVGPTPMRGLIVANHLGYLDILALSAIVPCVFVSKAEVEFWPDLRTLRALGRMRVCRASDERRLSPQEYPTHGSSTRRRHRGAVPGRPGHGQPPNLALPLDHAATCDRYQCGRYTMCDHLPTNLDDGSVEKEVCYWRDMTLWPDSMNLFGKRGVRAG